MRRGGIFGPVFRYESKIASRRWQVYAMRAIFVGLLLGCLSTIWRIEDYGSLESLRQQLVFAGQRFFYSTVIIELVLVLLAAPAATAGAICLDKSRGTLTHLLTTDLTDTEIVVGKLAARLLPVIALLACALPVSALAVMLGGVEPLALLSAFLVAIGVAILGCSLTMFLSVWGAKPAEVLAAVYMIWALWMIPWFVAELATRSASSPALDLVRRLIPFSVAIWPFNAFGTGGFDPSIRYALVFLGVMIGCSIVCAFLAVVSLRPASLRMANRKLKPVVESHAVVRFRRDVPWWPCPSLDKNPVLWREWHRARPTRWMRVVWGIYLGLTAVASSLCIASNLGLPYFGFVGPEASVPVLAIAAALGFLLMSVTSATSLAEERVRGSLDVLMATPLSTHTIVWGKWRGTFRLVVPVLFWPVLVCYAIVLRILPAAPVGVFYVLVPYGIAFGGFVTSLGLALACWTKRLGRALAIAVSIDVVLTLGPLLLDARDDSMLSMASPLAGIATLASQMSLFQSGPTYDQILSYGLAWAAIYATLAAFLFFAVDLTFNRVLGRASERPRWSRRARAHPFAVAAGRPSEGHT
jgi:ABC-type transport system involved in multi-copper enzyme maturation permease subunit